MMPDTYSANYHALVPIFNVYEYFSQTN